MKIFDFLCWLNEHRRSGFTYIAKSIRTHHPDWSDEQVIQEAKKIWSKS